MTVLEVSDLQRSIDFYVGKLGFFTHGAWGDPPSFCIVQRGGVTIALDRSRTVRDVPLNQYWAAYLYVENADALAEDYRAKGVEIVREPCDMDYGLRDFDVRDPDGHLIAFGHDLPPGDGHGLSGG